jgi:hypothetical protein
MSLHVLFTTRMIFASWNRRWNNHAFAERRAYLAPIGQLMRMDSVRKRPSTTNGKNLYFREPRDTAGAEAAIKELEKAGSFSSSRT